MMGNILDKLADYASFRVAKDKEAHPLDELKSRIANGEAPSREPFRFEKALSGPDMAFICEVKKASPSKGIIAENFPYLDIAREYEEAGADCISCLTEPKWFLGSDKIFTDIRAKVDTPMIRKDFTVDEYQIYQAKLMGADAVLLIAAILEETKLAKFFGLCNELGLSALFEAHDEAELEMAGKIGASLVGVNNRNLKDFTVDTGNSRRLREKAPANAIFVAESGIKSTEDVAALKNAGVNAVLIGETLMRASDKKKMLCELRGIS